MKFPSAHSKTRGKRVRQNSVKPWIIAAFCKWSKQLMARKQTVAKISQTNGNIATFRPNFLHIPSIKSRGTWLIYDPGSSIESKPVANDFLQQL
jgi:hypothetical protein